MRITGLKKAIMAAVIGCMVLCASACANPIIVNVPASGPNHSAWSVVRMQWDKTTVDGVVVGADHTRDSYSVLVPWVGEEWQLLYDTRAVDPPTMQLGFGDPVERSTFAACDASDGYVLVSITLPADVWLTPANISANDSPKAGLLYGGDTNIPVSFVKPTAGSDGSAAIATLRYRPVTGRLPVGNDGANILGAPIVDPTSGDIVADNDGAVDQTDGRLLAGVSGPALSRVITGLQAHGPRTCQ